MKIVLTVVGLLLLVGCGHATAKPATHTSPPATIQSVATELGCDNYQKDAITAPGSIESGSCELLGGLVTAQLYQMPSRAAGGYLVDIAKQSGVSAQDITWHGNVLVVTDAP